ncbi:MAG: TetR/AcrR family transcriptional regulator [Acidimicrobiales bacterium]
MARSPDPAVRVALIEAAARLLADDGLAALSIRAVAAAVGTSTMAVYTHFGSKDDLVHEVVREAFARLHAEIASVEQTADPVADLAATGAAYRRNALANAHLYRVMFSVNPVALTNPADHEGQPGLGLDAFGGLVDAVARCVDAGALSGAPGQLALQIWATAHGAVSLELAGFLGDTGQATFDAATTAAFLGLAAGG